MESDSKHNVYLVLSYLYCSSWPIMFCTIPLKHLKCKSGFQVQHFSFSSLINTGPDTPFKKFRPTTASLSLPPSPPLPPPLCLMPSSLSSSSSTFTVWHKHQTVYHLLHQHYHHKHNHQYHRYSFPSYCSCTNEGWFLKSILAWQNHSVSGIWMCDTLTFPSAISDCYGLKELTRSGNSLWSFAVCHAIVS